MKSCPAHHQVLCVAEEGRWRRKCLAMTVVYCTAVLVVLAVACQVNAGHAACPML